MPAKTRHDDETERSQRITEAAMRLAANRPWSQVSLGEIAAEAQITPAELYQSFNGRPAILDAVMKQVDLLMLAEAPDFSELPRDRLFSVLMRRFDALSPYKAALWNMADRLRQARPDALMEAGPAAFRYAWSVKWALEAAGISTAGLTGAARIKAVGFILLQVTRLWLSDDSEDGAKTMAALDRLLKRIEPVLGTARAAAPDEMPAAAGIA